MVSNIFPCSLALFINNLNVKKEALGRIGQVLLLLDCTLTKFCCFLEMF
jgi:hypothetical protein